MTRTAAIPRALMVGVLAFAVLGFASPALPATAVAKGETWVLDTWALTGLLGALCAAAAFVLTRDARAAVALLAGLGVAVFAALWADPFVQGPDFLLLAWFCGGAMIYVAVAYLRRLRVEPPR